MNKLSFLTFFTILALTAFPALASHTGETVHVKTMGLVCEFCAQAIEKVFMDTKKVESVDVDLDKALVTIVMKKDQLFTDEIVTTYIKEAGYTVEGIHHMAGAEHE